MTTTPEPRPDTSLPAIRQALSHPRDREGFDAGLPMAVEKARAAGDWREVDSFTHTWWIIASVSRQNPADRQRFWDTADEIRRQVDNGEQIPGIPLEQVIAHRVARQQQPHAEDERP